MADDLPFRAEYAKSGRSSCKKCKLNIAQGELRLAVIFQAAKFDGKMTSWYHFDCFFERQRPKSAGDIEHYDMLRWEDQERINEKLKAISEGTIAEIPKGKGKGQGKAKEKEKRRRVVEHPSDFLVEYAKSGRSTCRGCVEKIAKDEIRISKKGYDVKGGMRHGQMVDQWYHLKCFKERREELEFVDGIDSIPGFDSLEYEDKKKLKSELPPLAVKKRKLEGDAVDGGSSSPKKVKQEGDVEVKQEKEKESEKEEIKKQNKIMFKYRDDLEKLNKQELQLLLEFNDQDAPPGVSEKLDLLADIMTFGSLEKCKECKGQFLYKSGVGYVCTGNISGWTKCQNATTTPKRREFKAPPELKEEHVFLKKYSYKPRQRVIPALKRTIVKNTPEEVAVKAEIKTESKKNESPLKGLKFVLDSKLDKSKKEVEDQIKKFGGEVGSRVTEKIAAVISTKENLDEMSSKLEKAHELGIHVIEAGFLDAVAKGNQDSATFLITSRNIAKWECPNIEKRLGIQDKSKSRSKFSGKIGENSGMSDKLKLKLKGGGVVDPDSGLEDKAHVLKMKDALYSVVLGMVDIQSGRNSYYKIQVLEHDKKKKWYVFRAWGRVGTTIGDTKLTTYEDKDYAIQEFVNTYEEKTGNSWSKRNKFEKLPGRFYPLDIDYGEGEAQQEKMSVETSKSKLHKAIKELVCMLFDVDAMKRTMVEFELDLTKMPLGKLSKKQLEKAYKILGEAQELVDRKDVQSAKLVDLSNQFYTLIPHDYGRNTPPVLRDPDLIKAKLEMLESLMEIEIAFNLLKEGDAIKDKDPIDSHYEKLNTDIEVLDKSSEEYGLIEEYVKNTHAPTHTQYTLQIEEVFKVIRKGESKRFKPFSKLPNRKLLWHGSRVSNMAGILSQGLRIAPPEAPVTGYMFGKGIYFADMVSKSANYCVTTKSNPVGLMLLCDVALGKCYERKEADYIEKLKKEYQSVRGIGKTQPNPAESKMMGDVEVPCGKPVPTKVSGTSLLYNEFIVYDVAQVNIKYLIKTKFNYK